MKSRKLAIIISSLIIVAVGIVFYGKQFLFKMDWELISTAPSTDREYTIKYYRSLSEAGHAPYGDNLVIESWSSFPYPKESETFFAGYCGKSFEYHWENNKKIIIKCPTSQDPIRTQAIVVHGIKVEVIEE